MRRAWRHHRAVGTALEGLKPLALRVVDRVREQRLTGELYEAAAAGLEDGAVDQLEAIYLGFLEHASHHWGAADGRGNLDPRWRYRLARNTLSADADAAALVVTANPYLVRLPLSFNARWMAGLLERSPGTIDALEPRSATAAEYCLVGPGRRGPVCLPLSPEASDLVSRLDAPTRLDVLIARGVSRERIAKAVADELVLVFHKPEHVQLPNDEVAQEPGVAYEAIVDNTAATLALWNEDDQVEAYESFTATSGFYREMSRALVERAGVGGAERVGDLGCGTGVTLREILARLDGGGRVIGVDPARAMLVRARVNVPDARVKLRRGTAETLVYEALDNGRLQRVVCNSALWMTPDIVTDLGRIRGSLVTGGVFAFSAPANLLGLAPEATPAFIAFVEALGAAREIIGDRQAPSASVSFAPRIATPDDMTNLLATSAFADVDVTLWAHRWTMGEYLDWLDMPVMRLGMVSPERALEAPRLIALMRERLDPGLVLEHPYYFFVARAIA